MSNNHREQWASRFGLVLAMAGNAIGLGNFLRFPVQAASNGGGAFMIPYFIALILLGIPLMWIEWSMGRYGGIRGHGTTPGIFNAMWKHPIAKYIGILGIFLPLIVTIYYVYIESWTLAYSFFSVTGKYFGITSREGMGEFFGGFLGSGKSQYFTGIATAYIFFLITIAINVFIMYRGIAKGIETLAKIAMPALFLFGIVLVIRVFTLGVPHPAYPDRNVLNGLGFIWNPDFSQLKNGSVWLAATGQIFFTLSIGFGAIQTYASYLREKDDVALSGLTTSVFNEFAEVILGGSIAIPVACAFFGIAATQEIAKTGAFSLGFQSMPIIFQMFPFGQLFGTLWFLLLFFAGITSSVAISMPAVAFLEDEFKLTKPKAVLLVWTIVFICVQPVIFGKGFLDELDFWAGTFGLAFFALLEVVIFAWIFKMDKGWEEIHIGADIKIPKVFYYIIKYITPVYLLILLGAWTWQQGISVIMMEGVKPEEIIWKWGARLLMVGIILALIICVRIAWKNKTVSDEVSPE
ncbi:MAG: sodium:calcium symporter [Candidatus Schekmanbacteria bacterium RIFCSPHIGHO2_02_FULL_38_11]|uniref:Sodium:calcium symporter n=1 Tax=Candidatus Schekmanbacteria bacterium RIFCSPLOWO2_12_FULL_38_15 TaxID=1817883 RepID=A0A1F7SFK3_9BACT|nr:MAG: sodium:calcium symporter [Candidatus Schekmanbacteria bacterium RIFCSPLOWO2_02_FULL_38_14]OGL52562.1 MAG: sodium:calcium symporter [Candidatus Schekmanbacteria bacterium RIFCSPLOWO2_12_FULL_38_15]OGL53271.1 MAG: sodium:calcium symporter [Candidatus Schekmanbacteria bacterium RIFCSPHIGHO2_02_FULL_38_11]